jgi:hypothetical protein
VVRLVAAATPLPAGSHLAPSDLVRSSCVVRAGWLIGGMDVAMNANAVEVEKRQGTSGNHVFLSRLLEPWRRGSGLPLAAF